MISYYRTPCDRADEGGAVSRGRGHGSLLSLASCCRWIVQLQLN